MHSARLLAVGIALTTVFAATGIGSGSARAEPSPCVDSGYREQMRDLHNDFRATHHAPKLQLDDTLNKLAEDWAEHLAQTHTFEHRPNNRYGENLYMMTGGGTGFADAESAFRSWADEEAEYDYDKPGFSQETGHFTQVVWKDTQRMGVARVCVPETGETYVVANYDPPGNWKGRFPDNVEPTR